MVSTKIDFRNTNTENNTLRDSVKFCFCVNLAYAYITFCLSIKAPFIYKIDGCQYVQYSADRLISPNSSICSQPCSNLSTVSPPVPAMRLFTLSLLVPIVMAPVFSVSTGACVAMPAYLEHKTHVLYIHLCGPTQ